MKQSVNFEFMKDLRLEESAVENQTYLQVILTTN